MAAPRGLFGKDWWRNSSEKLRGHVLDFPHLDGQGRCRIICVPISHEEIIAALEFRNKMTASQAKRIGGREGMSLTEARWET
jgi:hypothetical protein